MRRSNDENGQGRGAIAPALLLWILCLGALIPAPAAAKDIADLRTALKAADAAGRAQIAAEMAESFPNDCGEDLRGLLADADGAVRVAALRAAAKAMAEELVPAVQGLLKHDDEATRREAVYTLIAMGETAADGKRLVDLLRADLTHADGAVRARAADLLAELTEGKDSVRDLLGLSVSPDSRVRQSGAQRLLAMKDKAVPGLRASAKDAEPSIRRQALTFLAEFATNDCAAEVGAALKDADASVRINAIRLAAKTGSEELVGRLAALLQHEDAETRREAVYALLELGEPEAGGKSLLDFLIADLSDKSPFARWKAAEILGGSGETRAIDPLIKVLADESPNVRARTVCALMQLKAKKAIPDIILLLDDDATSVQQEALTALRTLSGQRIGPDPEAWQKWWQSSQPK